MRKELLFQKPGSIERQLACCFAKHLDRPCSHDKVLRKWVGARLGKAEPIPGRIC